MVEHGQTGSRTPSNLSSDSSSLQESLNDGMLPNSMSVANSSSIDSDSLGLSRRSPPEVGVGDFPSCGFSFDDSINVGDNALTPMPDKQFALLNHPEQIGLDVIQHMSESMVGNDIDRINAIVNRAKTSSTSSLHVAAQRGNRRIVRLLLENNADCSKKDSAGLTPLLHATIEGHEAVTDLLLSHGASLHDVDNDHRSALHWAVLRRRDGLLRNLLKRCARDSGLLNKQTIEGRTPLFLAVDMNNEVAVELLLEFGATAA
jgi:ankyrin repeat protein